jgi:hypothetical protein
MAGARGHIALIAAVGVEQSAPWKAPEDAFAGESEAAQILLSGGMSEKHQRRADCLD